MKRIIYIRKSIHNYGIRFQNRKINRRIKYNSCSLLITILIGIFFLNVGCTNSNGSEVQANNGPKNIVLPPIFSDHSVLQQKSKVAIWGNAMPNTKIVINGSWGQKTRAITDKNGHWTSKIKTPKAGGPYQISISNNKEKLVLNDVMIGEVWLCSGQSNMEMPLKGFLPNELISGSEEAIQTANYPKIRMFTVSRNLEASPERDFEGDWAVCSPETASEFSATAFFFGRKLHQELGVPIGLIHSSWGGTPAESWTALANLKELAGFKNIDDKLGELANPDSEYNVWMDQLEQIPLAEFQNNYEILSYPEFVDINYDDKHWESMKIPNWLEGNLQSFDGIIWFRKVFELSNIDPAKTYHISLGGIDDEDITYVNGEKVGITKSWTAQRKYSLPKGLLQNGRNTIAVRMFDGASNGGIYGAKQFGIVKDDQVIQDLSGDWKYLPSAIQLNNKIAQFTTDQSFNKMPMPTMEVNSHMPTGLYNAMIHPLIPYSIKGAIWYQGESNVPRTEQYETLFPAMIQSWRNKWNSDFSFYFTQIAPYTYSGKDNTESAELRNAQNQTLSLANTGQAVTLDIGSLETIHPPNKKDVGERLALWALAKDYDKEGIAYSGPVCIAAKNNGNNVILDFNIGDKNLIAGKSGLKEFELILENGSLKEVSASIKGNQIILDNPSGQLPIAVRYSWKNGSKNSFLILQACLLPLFTLR